MGERYIPLLLSNLEERHLLLDSLGLDSNSQTFSTDNSVSRQKDLPLILLSISESEEIFVDSDTNRLNRLCFWSASLRLNFDFLTDIPRLVLFSDLAPIQNTFYWSYKYERTTGSLFSHSDVCETTTIDHSHKDRQYVRSDIYQQNAGHEVNRLESPNKKYFGLVPGQKIVLTAEYLSGKQN
jgi:hypothetical protein